MGEESMCDQSALEAQTGDIGDIRGPVWCEDEDVDIFCSPNAARLIIPSLAEMCLSINRISERDATRSKEGRLDLLDVLDVEETEEA